MSVWIVYKWNESHIDWLFFFFLFSFLIAIDQPGQQKLQEIKDSLAEPTETRMKEKEALPFLINWINLRVEIKNSWTFAEMQH